MARFFICNENIVNDTIEITGDDHFHLTKSLRAKISQKIVACTEDLEYNCSINEILEDKTICKILSKNSAMGEPSVQVFVYISVTKGDKLELVCQKVTELGAFSIIPFSSSRSIVKFDDKSRQKRKERLQKIVNEASKQCGRGKIPVVCDFLNVKDVCKQIKEKELAIVLYENEQDISLKDVISTNKFNEICIIVGPEGGFEQSEIDDFVQSGAKICSLGNRILRAETAPIACVSAIMYQTDNLGRINIGN